MNINEVLQKGKKQLIDNGIIDSLAASVLLSFVIGKNKEFLFANPDLEIKNDKANEYFLLLDKHIKGEPVAYLINEKEFFGISFYVDKRVLIPRPETELLVEHVIGLCDSGIGFDGGILKMLDVGTGSGNIPVSLAMNIKNAEFTACDISQDALEVARKNIENYRLQNRIKLVESNLIDEFKGQKFDIITANLPYIGAKEHDFVAKEVKNFEPNIALFGGDDGLDLYREMFLSLQKDVQCSRFLLGEIGFSQKDVLSELVLEMFPGQKLEIFKDLAGFDRYFVVHFKMD
ncbi:peptide chain release factor N(5)-glutamine methyltransferase [Patescibacteria group bacterium]|nr:peptide chain release factor N(5)-glutamine methyltransferase [Patescibacteria group bacterium]